MCFPGSGKAQAYAEVLMLQAEFIPTGLLRNSSTRVYQKENRLYGAVFNCINIHYVLQNKVSVPALHKLTPIQQINGFKYIYAANHFNTSIGYIKVYFG